MPIVNFTQHALLTALHWQNNHNIDNTGNTAVEIGTPVKHTTHHYRAVHSALKFKIRHLAGDAEDHILKKDTWSLNPLSS